MNSAPVLDRLASEPAGRTLLELAADRADVYVVGGYVRDALLGRPPREIDVVVNGSVSELAAALAVRLGGSWESHTRFGTALVRSPVGHLDLATARRERYPRPAALPEVDLGAPVEQDLTRRDFTVNAIAVALGGPDAGAVRSPAYALEDLAAGTLRVLHGRSFCDDPTRLLRLARYAQRLGFEVEPGTQALAGEAVAAAALASVSGARLGAELRQALTEPDPVGAMQSMERLGLLAALDPRLRGEAELARRALALLGRDGRADLLVLAACATAFSPASDLIAWLDSLEFPARDRDTVSAAAHGARPLTERLGASGRASEIYAAASGRPLEEVALAGALDAKAEPAARRWLVELRQIGLEIDGEDLIRAGIPAGPEIGRRLRATLAAKLDGTVGGREGELRAALAD